MTFSLAGTSAPSATGTPVTGKCAAVTAIGARPMAKRPTTVFRIISRRAVDDKFVCCPKYEQVYETWVLRVIRLQNNHIIMWEPRPTYTSVSEWASAFPEGAAKEKGRCFWDAVAETWANLKRAAAAILGRYVFIMPDAHAER